MAMLMRDLCLEDMKGITLPPKHSGTLMDYLFAVAVRAKDMLVNGAKDQNPAKENGPSLKIRFKLNNNTITTIHQDFVKEKGLISSSGRDKKKRKDPDDDYILDEDLDYIPGENRMSRKKTRREQSMDQKEKAIAPRVNHHHHHQDRVLEPSPALPEAFKNAFLREIVKEGSILSEGKLVIQKKLEDTDLKPGHNRLSMPVNSIRNLDFLTDAENNHLLGRKDDGKKNFFTVRIIEPSLRPGEVKLTRWVMGKPSGKESVMYVLNGTWNGIAARNGLKANMVVQVWAFRVDQELCLALVRL